MFNRDLAARWISKIFREKYPSSGDAPPDEIYREYAELLYSGVLKRDGDSPAIDQYEEWLRRNNSVEDFVGLLRQFRNSPESLNLRVWNRKNANREPQEKVHAILSVGAHCITSYTLKKHALRSFSGPFDWIFSNLGMASHCIADDFRTFLDRTYFAKIPEEYRISANAQYCDHLFYKEEYNVSSIFNHFDVTTEKNYSYYTRCAERFINSIRSGKRNILIAIISYELFNEQHFINLLNTIDGFPNQELLVIRFIESDWANFGFSLVEQYKSHKLLDMKITGEVGPVEFTHMADEMNFIRLLDNFTLS